MRLIIAGMKDFLTSTPPLQLASLCVVAVLLVLTIGRLLSLVFRSPRGETFAEGSMYGIEAEPAVWDDFKALIRETGLPAGELLEQTIRAYREQHQ